MALWVAGSGAGMATAQEVLFSLSADGNHSFGTLEDQEIALRRTDGTVEPWLRTISGTFFSGDRDADGLSEVWNDVDALSMDTSGAPVVSLLQDLVDWKDGDILRLTTDGHLEVLFAESAFVQDFGLLDGNCDVDAFHYDASGVHLLSFAEVEDSSVLSSDGGKIADGAILSWDEASGKVAVVYSEAEVDGLVTVALGVPTTTSDTLSVARNAVGEILFSVQSPSDNDASVFSEANFGTLVLSEAAFGFQNTVELDALTVTNSVDRSPVAHAVSSVIAQGQPFALELRGEPGARTRVLVAFDRGDAGSFQGPGFSGLFLSASDPLLWWSLGTAWLKVTLDGNGFATLNLPIVPVGSPAFTVLGQPWDLDHRWFGVPFALDSR